MHDRPLQPVVMRLALQSACSHWLFAFEIESFSKHVYRMAATVLGDQRNELSQLVLRSALTNGVSDAAAAENLTQLINRVEGAIAVFKVVPIDVDHRDCLRLIAGGRLC
jgi:hypothetical protein